MVQRRERLGFAREAREPFGIEGPRRVPGRKLIRSDGIIAGPRGGPAYFRRTRVPRIFWALSVLRNDGMTRSISSK